MTVSAAACPSPVYGSRSRWGQSLGAHPCMLSVCERRQMALISLYRGLEHTNSASMGTSVLTASACTFSQERVAPVMRALRKTNHVNLGAYSSAPPPLRTYLCMPCGDSHSKSTLTVSPALPRMSLRRIHPDISLPKSTSYAFSPTALNLTGCSTSVTLSEGEVWADITAPSGPPTTSVLSHPSRGESVVAHPGVSMRAS